MYETWMNRGTSCRRRQLWTQPRSTTLTLVIISRARTEGEVTYQQTDPTRHGAPYPPSYSNRRKWTDLQLTRNCIRYILCNYWSDTLCVSNSCLVIFIIYYTRLLIRHFLAYCPVSHAAFVCIYCLLMVICSIYLYSLYQ